MAEDLRGAWLFDIGDDPVRSAARFNDAQWRTIFVPSPWEDEGYPGYDGYAWYRRHFTAPPDWKEKTLYLDLGNIDDVDEVYVNGSFIGFSGEFPPHYVTAYGADRDYPLPQWCLNIGGDNVIAVRVYDQELSGGIIRGKIGIYEYLHPLRPDQPLSGSWRIMVGDDLGWKEPSHDDSRWRQVRVPAFWETQGMKGYDGFAWYRFHFRPSPDLEGRSVVLLLGKVDDLDETYLNGERIGHTGQISSKHERMNIGDQYRESRAYTVPSGALRFGEDNVIAVRVYDRFLHGGIYDGPVGLITRNSYLQWKERQNSERKGLWDLIRDAIR